MWTGVEIALAEQLGRARLGASLDGDRRVVEDAQRRARRRHDAAAVSRSRPPRLERVVALGDLEGRLGVAACGRVPARPSVLRVRRAVPARWPGTPRPGGARARRSSISPTTGRRRRGPGRRPRRGARPSARCFSASMSAAARSRIRSSSSRVAAMSASRVSWATFWARARMSFASRRASARRRRAPASALSRSRRACSASLSPCSIRSRRSSSILETGLSANAYQDRDRKSRKLAALTMTQKRLIWNCRPPSAASRTTSPPSAGGDGQEVHDGTPSWSAT